MKESTDSQNRVGRPPRGLDPWIGLLRREVFDAVMSQGVDAAVEVLSTTTLSRLCRQLSTRTSHCRGAGQGTWTSSDHYQELDRSGRSPGKPVLATGKTSTIWSRKMIIGRSLSVVSVIMINRTIGHHRRRCPASTTAKAHFRTTNEISWDGFAFGRRLGTQDCY